MPSYAKRLREIVGSQMGAEIVEFNLEKAIKDARDKSTGPVTTFYDPVDLFMGRDWLLKRGSALTSEDLRMMAKNPIIGSIIQTRLNQIAAYTTPQESQYDLGFTVKPVVEGDEAATKDSKAKSDMMAFLYGCGQPGYGDNQLETFVRKFIRDSLTLDQACAEVVYSRNGKAPSYFVAIDGATIRKTKESLNYAINNPATPQYVQVVDDIVLAEYTDEKMMFGIRNPQTDLSLAGYGMSEMEMLIRVVTMILNTEKYNNSLLAQGGTSKGILVVKGDLAADNLMFEDFKRDFREALRNAADYWKAPVLRISKEGEVDWLALDRAQRDMEYAQLFDFLVKQSCGVYQMAPEEINWSIGATGAKVNFEASAGTKLTHSQQKGLKPLLSFLENCLNRSIVSKKDPRYKVSFVGMNSDREADSVVHMREVQNYKTINEVRADIGLGPVKGGDVILNNSYLKLTVPEFSAPRAALPGERDVNVDPQFDTTRKSNVL